MTNTATETLSVVVEREIAYPPEKIWRALTQPHLIEEWLMKKRLQTSRWSQFQPSRRLGRRAGLRGPGRRAEQDVVLHLEFCARRCGLQSRERGDLYAHRNEHG